jgi:RNA polymerase sigma factor (sigma-70 family)
MVLRVCRSLLKNSDDAEDACQATFFVLVQRARYVWVRDSLAPWLHRVAHRVASRAKASSFRRREHERRAAELKLRVVYDGVDSEGLAGLLHKEIDRLPQRYRSAVVVCDLEGLSHERAARRLGWPVGTVKSRLARARQILRSRLSARRLTAPAVLAIIEAATSSVDAAVSLRTVECALRAAVLVAKAPTIEVISVDVANLAEEVLQTMFLTKVKLTWAAVLIACALATGTAAVLGRQSDGPKPTSGADRPGAKRADIARAAPDNGATEAPAFIRQSRSMIITRLEQELARANARLDRTLRRVGSPNDPAAVQGRKTVDEIEGLLARIDGVLVDAVDRFPTMFDFSGEQGDLGSTSMPSIVDAEKLINKIYTNRFISETPVNWQEPNRKDRAGDQGANSATGAKNNPVQGQGNDQNSQSKSGYWQGNNPQGQSASQSGSSSGSANKESAQGQNNAPSSAGKPGNSQTKNAQDGQKSSGKPQNQQNANPQDGTKGKPQNSGQDQQQGKDRRQQQTPSQGQQQDSGRSQQPDSNPSQQQGAHDIGTVVSNGGQRKSTRANGNADVQVGVLERNRVVEIGSQTTFQIRLRNYGHIDASNLRVTANLSQNLKYLSAGTRSHDVGVRFRSEENAVEFQRIAKLAPGKEIILGVTARVTGSASVLATCRASVTHDELPNDEKLEDLVGIKVTPASGN